MTADLYVYAGSFEYNGTDSDIEVLNKLQSFRDLFSRVDLKENRFFFNNEEFLATTLLADGTTCEMLIYQRPEDVNRDIRNIFLSLITKGIYKTTSVSGAEIDGFIGVHDETSCSAKVVLNRPDQCDITKHVVANYDDWLVFRAHMLGLYPGDSTIFYSECAKLFDNLNFSNEYMHLTDEVLVSHPIRICDALCHISRFMLPEYESFEGSNIDFPQNFAGNHGFDGGSFQGKKDDQLIAHFNINGNVTPIERICEPHFKFNTPDEDKQNNPDINKYCRIYFVMPRKGDKEIYIGSIRRHVD